MELLAAQCKCAECGREFQTVDQYEKHLEGHKRKKPFKCKECKFACDSQYRLDLHMHKHSADDNRFDCELCDASFKWKGKLFVYDY